MLRYLQSVLPVQTPLLLFGLVSIVLYLIGLITARWLKRRVNVGLGWTSHLFVASASVTIAARLLGVDFPERPAIGFVAALSAAFPIIALLRRFVWPLYGYPGEKARIPSFLPQVVAIVLFVLMTLLGLAAFYHVTVAGILTGSGLIAIIIGLALQDILGNIFAGFGLQAGKAYRVGDWLIVDDKPIEVVEFNWRSTRFRTNDDVSIDIPNSHLAKSTIVNLYYPTHLHATRIRVGVDNIVPPNQVKDAISKATAAAPGVLKDPPVKVFLIGFEESAAQYEVKFSLADARLYSDIVDAVRTNIWYELSRRRIRLAFDKQEFELIRNVHPSRRREADLGLLASQSLFSSLDQSQLERLATGSDRIRFGRGETIISQGAAGNSMFVLASGSAEVRVEREGRAQPVGRLESGDCFGEISLLTGEPRSATVVALFDCEIIEIQKKSIGNLLHEHPELAEALSETVVARRYATQSQLDSVPVSDNGPETITTKERVLRRLRKFFEL